MSGDVKHDYHLVNPSPWPLIGSLGAFTLAIGAVLWMNKDATGDFGGMAGQPCTVTWAERSDSSG